MCVLLIHTSKLILPVLMTVLISNFWILQFNFVGRILGPRGNSLKRVEATTGCRVLIRGRGSIKDTAKEDKMRDKPGFEHLNEPLHVLVEAELPANIIDAQLIHAREILQELLKPVVWSKHLEPTFSTTCSVLN
jgi:hypothetical protein